MSDIPKVTIKPSLLDVCLSSLTVYREARGEPYPGQLGVAWVIRNRAALAGWMGKTPSAVCTKKWQFSSMTDPHDPQLATWPADDAVWDVCVQAVQEAFAGTGDDPTGGATHYHDISIALPQAWGDAQFLTQIGRLRFYRAA